MRGHGVDASCDIEARVCALFSGQQGYWGCKDGDSVFVYANEEYARLIGLKHHQDVIGRTDFDMPCGTVACAAAFREQDREVMHSDKPLRILDVHPFADGHWHAYLTIKRPFNHQDGRLAGTSFHGQDITSPTMIELGSLLGRLYSGDVQPGAIAQGSYHVGEFPSQPVSLTARESEVLFFLIRGQPAKRIAEIFRMSVRTVEDHIVSVRQKFLCASKAALIEKAIYLGYLCCIPKTIFSQQLSLVLRD